MLKIKFFWEFIDHNSVLNEKINLTRKSEIIKSAYKKLGLECPVYVWWVTLSLQPDSKYQYRWKCVIHEIKNHIISIVEGV